MVFPGVHPDEVAVKDFKVPRNWKFKLIPDVAGVLLRRLVWVVPEVDESACTGCGDCVRVCAAQAIALEAGRARVSRDRCVSCLCCHEACPGAAIGTRISRLARLLA
jgi:ferredoxin